LRGSGRETVGLAIDTVHRDTARACAIITFAKLGLAADSPPKRRISTLQHSLPVAIIRSDVVHTSEAIMRGRTAFAGMAFFVAIACGFSSAAARDPKPFARVAEINRPIEQVFNSLRGYFSTDSTHDFELISADKAHWTIKARRTGIDDRTWGEWAYCKVAATGMLDSLEDTTVLVKVALERDGKSKTHVSLMPDFVATYSSLTGSKSTVPCQSMGKLETDILRAAGATAEEAGD
jgi:hypothetical protein